MIGESIAAKLISHSGSLATLSKYPASTIQILGAEKALFRALKQKTKTPKYGLLYNTTFIGRAMGKNKGKISRFLANKCAMAARLDNYLVNVKLYLYSQLTNSEKNLKNKSKEDWLKSITMKNSPRKTSNLWTKSCNSWEKKNFILIHKKSLESIKRSWENRRRLKKLQLLKKSKNNYPRRRRKLLKNDSFQNYSQ